MVIEMIKTISEIYSWHIPKGYINKRVEILILPFSYDEEKSTLNNDIFEKTLGILKNNNLDPVEWQKEIRNEWNK